MICYTHLRSISSKKALDKREKSASLKANWVAGLDGIAQNSNFGSRVAGLAFEVLSEVRDF